MAKWVVETRNSAANPYYIGLDLEDGRVPIPLSIGFVTSPAAEEFITDTVLPATYEPVIMLSDAEALRLVITFLQDFITRLNSGQPINGPVPASMKVALKQLSALLDNKEGKASGSDSSNSSAVTTDKQHAKP